MKQAKLSKTMSSINNVTDACANHFETRGHEENDGSNSNAQPSSTSRVREHRKRMTAEEKASKNATRREKRAHETMGEKQTRFF